MDPLPPLYQRVNIFVSDSVCHFPILYYVKLQDSSPPPLETQKLKSLIVEFMKCHCESNRSQLKKWFVPIPFQIALCFDLNAEKYLVQCLLFVTYKL